MFRIIFYIYWSIFMEIGSPFNSYSQKTQPDLEKAIFRLRLFLRFFDHNFRQECRISIKQNAPESEKHQLQFQIQKCIKIENFGLGQKVPRPTTLCQAEIFPKVPFDLNIFNHKKTRDFKLHAHKKNIDVKVLL